MRGRERESMVRIESFGWRYFLEESHLVCRKQGQTDISLHL